MLSVDILSVDVHMTNPYSGIIEVHKILRSDGGVYITLAKVGLALEDCEYHLQGSKDCIIARLSGQVLNTKLENCGHRTFGRECQ